MRSQKAVVRKSEKEKSRRADYTKKRNILNNAPMDKVTVRREVYANKVKNGKTVMTVDGRPELEHVGYRESTKKIQRRRADKSLIRSVEYPKSRKIKAKKDAK